MSKAMPNDDDDNPVQAEIPPATGGLAAAFGLWSDLPDEPFAVYEQPVYEQPAVIYVAANGMWLPRPYPHVDAVAYYPRAEHDALHQRCAEAEALRDSYECERERMRADLYASEAERDAALAALRAVVEAWERDDDSCLIQHRTDLIDAIEAARAILTGT